MSVVAVFEVRIVGDHWLEGGRVRDLAESVSAGLDRVFRSTGEFRRRRPDETDGAAPPGTGARSQDSGSMH